MKVFFLYLFFFIIAYVVTYIAFPVAYKLGIWYMPYKISGLSNDQMITQVDMFINLAKAFWVPLYIAGHYTYIKLAKRDRKYGIVLSLVFIILVTSTFGFFFPKLVSVWWLYICIYMFYIVLALIIPFELSVYFKRKNKKTFPI